MSRQRVVVSAILTINYTYYTNMEYINAFLNIILLCYFIFLSELLQETKFYKNQQERLDNLQSFLYVCGYTTYIVLIMSMIADGVFETDLYLDLDVIEEFSKPAKPSSMNIDLKTVKIENLTDSPEIPTKDEKACPTCVIICTKMCELGSYVYQNRWYIAGGILLYLIMKETGI